MGIKLIEVKSNHLKKDEKEFLFKESVSEHILNWEDLYLDDESLKGYLKKHPFPKDKYYNEETFLKDLKSEGYVSVGVEKEETADYLASLLYDLV